MPSTRLERARTAVRARAPWRRAFGQRTVRRTVQGVPLYLPWSHLLPDYARSRPTYGQNLVELAAGLGACLDGPLPVLDVGANIGDSAAQIMARTDARVLCVEGDPYWVTYLRRNLGDEPRATIERVLLTALDGEWGAASPVRVGGTTRFVQDVAGPRAQATVSAAELRARHREFDDLRLVKCDTDGFDPVLVPAVAQAWADRGPVLFFEFDPVLARIADLRDPHELWPTLARLGYTRLAVWDNAGDPLGQLDITNAAKHAAELEPRPVHRGYHFWDVAAARWDDQAALAVFDQLMPEPFDVRGTWR